MNEQVYVLKDVIRNPTRAFKEISARGRDFLLGAIIIVCIPAFLTALFLPDASLIHSLFGCVVWWLVLVGCVYVVGGLLNGKADFMGLLSATGYAQLPMIIIPIIGALLVRPISEEFLSQLSALEVILLINISFITFIGFFLAALIVLAWIFVLCILASRECHKFNTWKAFVSVVVGELASISITNQLLTVTGL